MLRPSSLLINRLAIIACVLCTLPAHAQEHGLEPVVEEVPVTLSPRVDIMVSESEAPHLSTIGLNSTDAEESWAFSEPERVLSLLESEALPQLHSAALRPLLVQLLTRPADIAFWRSSQKDAWHEKRLNLLIALEAYEEAQKLQQATPLSLQDASWQQRQHDLAFFTYDEALICDDLEIFPRIEPEQQTYWPLYCHSYNQDYEKAALASQLLYEQSSEPPIWLEALIARKALDDLPSDAEKGALPAWPTTPLSSTMLFMMHSATNIDDSLRPSNWPMHANIIATRPHWASNHPALPAHATLDALASAHVKGHAVGDQWRTQFERAFNQPDIQTTLIALENKNADWSMAEMMRYYRDIRQQYTVSDTVDAYMEMFTNMTPTSHSLLAALLVDDARELSRAIFRKHAVSHFAPIMSRIFLLNGQWGEAKPWLSLAQKSLEPSAMSVIAQYSPPLLQLQKAMESGQHDMIAEIELPQLEAVAQHDNDDSRFMQARLMAIFEGFGIAPTPEATTEEVTATEKTADYWRQQLREAGENKQYAELLLLSGHLLAEQHERTEHKLWTLLIQAFLAHDAPEIAWALSEEALQDALARTGH